MPRAEDVFDALKYRVVVDLYGAHRYYNQNNQLHRENGPAVVFEDNSRQWYLNGKLHRENGPAIEWGDRAGYWYKHGLMHRTDGPAVIWPDGATEWWLNGVKYTEQEFLLADKTHGINDN